MKRLFSPTTWHTGENRKPFHDWIQLENVYDQNENEKCNFRSDRDKDFNHHVALVSLVTSDSQHKFIFTAICQTSCCLYHHAHFYRFSHPNFWHCLPHRENSSRERIIEQESHILKKKNTEGNQSIYTPEILWKSTLCNTHYVCLETENFSIQDGCSHYHTDFES